ncbi:putative glycerol-3-phosphate cytidylyltransferase [Atopobium sp. BS2]|uniref:Gfo/Idh/MocA family oxidoreductase n=1 Tax=Atopobium sp. BS2 TaxID=936550 RepID=UPI00044B0A6F|nr:Gfo/Idh/MocA family oxidoreductase [Atopobium sp. BS2]EWC94124.1 putative glycerol-3-phosphate cytidylyltransferase [Atopobium sp. BS2]
MTKVITYGTFDLLHYGHTNLLKRAKDLGDYLIVGVTAEAYDMARGKINVKQSLSERIENVRETGLADEIIVEEYEGQKIDDIRRYGADIFAIGSDWKGKFDYLSDYCKVVYLDRTKGISSTELRSEERKLSVGLIGDASWLDKYRMQARFVNGMEIEGIATPDTTMLTPELSELPVITSDISDLLQKVDAVVIASDPSLHEKQIRQALEAGKHVLCESPFALTPEAGDSLVAYAQERGLVLQDAIKTAYSTAFHRLVLLVKGGKIGKVVSVDATCTSLRYSKTDDSITGANWGGMGEWGPIALLPIFQILGTDYTSSQIITRGEKGFVHEGEFTKIDFVYPSAVASMKVATGVKSEGELVISGTDAYVYVPAPWWKTDYFEIRYENPADNKRYFYQLDGEGFRFELITFAQAIANGASNSYISRDISRSLCKIMGEYYLGTNILQIR